MSHCSLIHPTSSYSIFQGERFVGAVSTIKARAPVTGGNFGVWGGMFSTFDCAVKGVRQKEDAWNAIISGFMTGGCLAARSTFRMSLIFQFVSGKHDITSAIEAYYGGCISQSAC